MSKEGSTISGIMNSLTLALSMNLQYGVPLEVLCSKLVNTRFEPAGFTQNNEIPMAKSFMDYVGRWLALKFLTKEQAMQYHSKDLIEKAYSDGSKSKDAFAMRLPVVDEGTQAAADFMPMQTSIADAADESKSPASKLDEAKQQGFTGSMCSGCGSMKMKRNGSCEVCLDCGATSGCS